MQADRAQPDRAGAGVVFQVAGGCGLGALDAAKEKGVWGIGVDADQSFLGPHILTSAVKRVDTAVFLAIKSVVDGKFKGGNMTFGLKDNGVGIGKISSKVPDSEVAKVNQSVQTSSAGKSRTSRLRFRVDPRDCPWDMSEGQSLRELCLLGTEVEWASVVALRGVVLLGLVRIALEEQPRLQVASAWTVGTPSRSATNAVFCSA